MKCTECEFCVQDFDGGLTMPYSCCKSDIKVHMPAHVAEKEATENNKCGKMKEQV